LKTSDIIPVSPHEAEFEDWLKTARSPGAPRTQHPLDELIGEHHLIDVVLAAIERGARRLSVHEVMQPEFWEDVVDFVGNFVVQCHHRKEEEALLPLVRDPAEGDAAPPAQVLSLQHDQARQLAYDLLDGVNEGDWEKLLRAAHLFIRLEREHLVTEERDVFEPARRIATAAELSAARATADAVERAAFQDRDRLYYVAVARRLTRAAGLPDPLVAGLSTADLAGG
jgi:hemerythrin-like domain-containing protein